MKQRAGRRAFRGWLVGWMAAAFALGLPCAPAQNPPQDAAPMPNAGVAVEGSAVAPAETPTAEPEPGDSATPSATAEATAASIPLPSATKHAGDLPAPTGQMALQPGVATGPPTHTPTPSAGPASPTADFAATHAAASPPLPSRRAAERATPGVRRLDRPRLPSSAPERGISIELLLSGALVGLFSALLGYGAARLGQGSRRRRARAALATAMLAELRWLDALLRAVVEQGSARSDYPVDHPIIEAGLRDLTLFRPETAARIAQFHDLLRSLRYEMTQLRDNPRRWTGRMPEFDRLLKARAAMACRAVPGLIKELRAEGGQSPPPLADRALDAEPGELPPKPFASGESDDWTL